MITQLSPSDFSTWRDNSSTAGAGPPVVIDVREPWETQTASVKADRFELLFMPMRDVPTRLAELQASHGTGYPIACLCHHGMRSLQVANYLAQNGFTEVVNLQGGIDAWSQQLDHSVPRY